MQLNEYQKRAVSTKMYPANLAVIYPSLGLGGESGEVLEKVKKVVRDNNSDFTNAEFRTNMRKELGDVLWYVANIAEDLGISMDDIAMTNLEKLQSRKERGVLHGSGDNR